MIDFTTLAWWLIPASFVTAVLTAAMGAGGGVLLLAWMSVFLPVVDVVPLHGAIMAWQNGVRWVFLSRYTDWSFVGVAMLGSGVGAMMAGPLAVHIPPFWAHVLLGVGLLYLVWAPKKLALPSFRGKVILVACLTSFVSMLIGAAGVLFAALRRQDGVAKEGILADQSILMLTQHGLKFLVFGVAGFAYAPYIPLLVGMAAAGLCGTMLGLSILKRMQPVWFDGLFKLMVSILAGKLLVDALSL